MKTMQEDVQAVIDQLVESGAERGLQAAVYRRGDLVVDAVAGVADPASGRPFTSEPDTKTGYHAQTFGWIVGEIVRRASGKRISQVLAEEVAGPLGVADELFFGVPESQLGRPARLEDQAWPEEAVPEGDPEPVMFGPAGGARGLGLGAAGGDAGRRLRQPDILTVDIPAGGTMTARAVARMYAALLGEVDGVRLVSDERLRVITTVVAEGVDEVLGFPAARGLGYDIGGEGGPLDSPTLFGMGGSGGTAAHADPSSGIVIAVIKNRNTFGDFTTSNAVAGAVAAQITHRG